MTKTNDLATPRAAAAVPSVRFNLATAARATEVLTLMREFYAVEHLAFDERRARAAVEELLAHRALGAIFLIEAGDGDAAALLGYGVVTFGFSLELHGRFALLDELYLREAARGLGLGKASLAFVEQFCRHEGIGTLRLEVARDNARAHSIYARAGYADPHNRDLLTKLLPAD